MANKYLITAHCDNPECRTTEFQKLRKKRTYSSTDGHEHIVDRLSCPECRQLGHVDKITTLETRRAVA